jgi:hypothetical protein
LIHVKAQPQGSGDLTVRNQKGPSMRRTPAPGDTFLRAAAASAGAALLASAALAARLAWQHMSLLGEICGGSTLIAHCGWCPTAVGLAAAGLASFAWAGWPAGQTAPLPRG